MDSTIQYNLNLYRFFFSDLLEDLEMPTHFFDFNQISTHSDQGEKQLLQFVLFVLIKSLIRWLGLIGSSTGL